MDPQRGCIGFFCFFKRKAMEEKKKIKELAN